MAVASIRSTRVVDLLGDTDMMMDDSFVDLVSDDLLTLDQLIDDRFDAMTGARSIVMSTTCADDTHAFFVPVTASWR